MSTKLDLTDAPEGYVPVETLWPGATACGTCDCWSGTECSNRTSDSGVSCFFWNRKDGKDVIFKKVNNP